MKKTLVRLAALALLALSLGGAAHAQNVPGYPYGYPAPYGAVTPYTSNTTTNMTSTGSGANPYGYPSNAYGYPANAYGYPANAYGYPANAYGYPANTNSYTGGTFPYAGSPVNSASSSQVGVPRMDGSVLLPSGQIYYPVGSTIPNSAWPYSGRQTVTTPTAINPNPQTGTELLQYYQMHPRNF